MKVKEKAAVMSGPEVITKQAKPNTNTNTNTKGKLNAMLRLFADGERLHRFQAERIGDHCLPTSVSDLQIKHLIKFSRERVKVPNRFGSGTSVCEYWLEGDQLQKAREITGAEEVTL